MNTEDGMDVVYVEHERCQPRVQLPRDSIRGEREVECTLGRVVLKTMV